MAIEDIGATQTGGESPVQEGVAMEGSQTLDLSPKEIDAESEILDQEKKNVASQMKNLSVEEDVKTSEDPNNEASNYIPVKDVSKEAEVAQTPQESTAKSVLDGGQSIEDQDKVFNRLGGLKDIYEKANNKKRSDTYDSKMSNVMSENNVVIKEADVDNSSFFDESKIKTSITDTPKIVMSKDVTIEQKPVVVDVDDESDESVRFGDQFLSTQLDSDIVALNEENKKNSIVSEGEDGFLRTDITSSQDGEPDEDGDKRKNGYYFMKGKAYFKNEEGSWFKLYPTDKWKKKKYKEEGYNTYNSKWIKLDDENRIKSLNRKATYQPYGEVKEKGLLKMSNDLIRTLQSGYNDPVADLSGEFQDVEGVTINPLWGYQDKISPEEARKEIGRKGKGKFLMDGDYKYLSRDYQKLKGKWYYKSEDGVSEIPYGKMKQIFDLEKAAIPLSQLKNKNETFVNIVQSIQTANLGNIMAGIIKPIDDFFKTNKTDLIKGYTWLQSLSDRSGSSLNDRAAEAATDIAANFYSGTLNEAQFELIKSFGVMKDQYIIDSEDIGDIGNLWRNPDPTGGDERDISTLFKDPQYKKGLEVISFLADGNTLKANMTNNGIYHVGADYLIKENGRWTYPNGKAVTDRNLIKTFDNSGKPGVFGFGDVAFSGMGSNNTLAILDNIDSDLPILSEVKNINNGRISSSKELMDTDLYKMYNSSSIMKSFIKSSLKDSNSNAANNLLMVLDDPEKTSMVSYLNSTKSLMSGPSFSKVIKALDKGFKDFNQLQIDKQKIKRFSENSFSESNFSDEQRESIEASQEEAFELLDKMQTGSWLTASDTEDVVEMKLSMYTTNVQRFIGEIDRFAAVSQANNNIVKNIEESGNSTDKQFFLRKLEYEQKFDRILPTGTGSILENSLTLFKYKKDLAEFVIDLEEKGLVDIDEKGSISYNSERIKASGGAAYLEKIEAKLESLNNSIANSRGETWNKNSEKLAEIDASLRNIPVLKESLLTKYMSSQDRDEKTRLSEEMKRLDETETVLESKKENLEIQNYAVINTMPEELAEKISSSVEPSILKPYLESLEGQKGLSAKNRVDLLTESMIDRMEDLIGSEQIDVGYADAVVHKFKDLLSWPGFVELSPSEKEYYQLATTVKSLLPIYLNNEYGFTDESVGFFDSFFASMYKTAFKNTAPASDAGGLFVSTDVVGEKEKAASLQESFNQAGIDEKDFTSRQKLDQLIYEAERVSDIFSGEFGGEILGGSMIYLGALAFGGGVSNKIFKLAVGFSKLGQGKAGISIVERGYNNIPKLYARTLGRTRVGRFLEKPFETGLRFKFAGTLIGATSDEMTFTGGVLGGVGVKGLQLLGKSTSLAGFNKFAESMFGKEGWAKATQRVQTLGGMGIGEVAEETGQAFAKALNETDSMVDMFSYLEESYGNINAIGKHVIGSFVAGVLFGVGLGGGTKSQYEGLDAETKAKVDASIKEISADLNASADTVKEYLESQGGKVVNLEENSKEKSPEGEASPAEAVQKINEEASKKETQEESKKETQEESIEATEEQSDTQPKEQVEQEKEVTATLEEQFNSLEEEQRNEYIRKAESELKEERIANRKDNNSTVSRIKQFRNRNKYTQEDINERAQEIYVKQNSRKNIGKNVNTAKGQRVSVDVNPDSDYAGIEMNISDEFGNEVGTILGSYDADGNFQIEDVSIIEGSQGNEYATEAIGVINSNTNNNVIIKRTTQSTDVMGKSLETSGEATQDANGDYIVNNTAENIELNEDARVKYKSDETAADKIRSLKVTGSETTIDENGNTVPAEKRNSLQFFDAAWNASMEAAAVTIEKGGSLFKTLSNAKSKFQKTAFYQSFKTEAEKDAEMYKFMVALEEKLGTEEFSKAEKAYTSLKKKAEAQFKKSDYYTSLVKDNGSNDLSARRKAMVDFRAKLDAETDRLISERMKSGELGNVDNIVTDYAAKSRKSRDTQIDMKESISSKIRRATEKENKKDPSYLKNIKKEILSYMEQALPKGKYTKKELISFATQINNAATAAQAEKIFKRIDKKSERSEKQNKQQQNNDLIERIENLPKKGKELYFKNSKIKVTPEALKQLEQFLTENDLSQDAIEAMSTDEIVLLHNSIDEIINTGKLDQQKLVKERNDIRRTEKATVLEGFNDLLNKKSMTIEELAEMDSKEVRGSFIIDGQLYTASEAISMAKKVKKETSEDVVEQVAPEESVEESLYKKQDKTAEVTISDKKLWGEATFIREKIENAGDIFREIAMGGKGASYRYIQEKIDKLQNFKRELNSNPVSKIPSEIKTIEEYNEWQSKTGNYDAVDGFEYIQKFHKDALDTIKKEYEDLRADLKTPEQQLALDAVLNVIDGNMKGLTENLIDLNRLSRKLKEKSIEPETKTEDVVEQVAPEESVVEEVAEEGTTEEGTTEEARDINFYPSMDMSTEGSEGKTGWWGNAFNQFSISDIEGLSRLLYMNSLKGRFGRKKGEYKGNKQLKEYIENKILIPIKWAFATEQTQNQEIEDNVRAEIKRIFGDGVLDKAGRVAGTKSILSSELSRKVDNSKSKFHAPPDGGALKEGYQKSKELTNDEVIDLYLYGKDSESRAVLERQGYKMDAVDQYIKENSNLLKYSEFIEKQYNVVAKESFSSTFAKYKGVEGFGDAYYYPRNTVKATGIDESKVLETLIDQHGQKGIFLGPKTAANSHVETRTKMGKDVNLNIKGGATQKLLAYMRDMNHTKNFLEVADATGLLLSNNEVKNAISKSAGKSNFAAWKAHMDTILSPTSETVGSSKLINKATTVAVVTQLAFETKNLGKQLTSATHWTNAGLKYGMPLFNLDPKQVMKTFQKTKGESKENYNERIAVMKMVMGSAFVRQRFRGGDVDVAINNVLNESSSGMTSQAIKASMFFTRLGDMGGVVLGGIPFTAKLYKKYRTPIDEGGRGMSHEQAMKAAYVAFTAEATDVQQSTRADQRSLSQGNAMIRALTTYTTSQQSAVKRIINAKRAFATWDMQSKEQKKQAVWDMIYYPTFGNFIFQSVSTGYISSIIWDDDDEGDPDVTKRKLHDTAWNTVQSVSQGFGLLGKLPDMLINSLRGQEWFNNIPFYKKMLDVTEGSIEMMEEIMGDAKIEVGDGSFVGSDTEWDDIMNEEALKIQFLSLPENKDWFKENGYESEYDVLIKKKSELPNGGRLSITKSVQKAFSDLWDQRVEEAKGKGLIEKFSEYMTPEIEDFFLDKIGEWSKMESGKDFMNWIQDYPDVYVGKSARMKGSELQKAIGERTVGVKEEDLFGAPSQGKDDKIFNFFSSIFGDGEEYVMERMKKQGFTDLSRNERNEFTNKLKEINPEKYNDYYIDNIGVKELNDLWTEIVNYGVQYQAEDPAKRVDKETVGKKIKKKREISTGKKKTIKRNQ